MTIRPLEIGHARDICGWTYEAPFDVFNWPSWEHMQKDGIEFGDPVLREEQYAAVLGDSRELIGYAQFFPIAGVTRLGFGLRPDLCGGGLGPAFVRVIALEASERTPGNEIDLEVLAWNTRAIRAYERAGFRIADSYARPTPSGYADFHCMVFDPASAAD
ncbi:GNAT family N-acetyltransferase [Paenibacillus arenilitoris]|uniref:GNAT family N-acetyltransferase n=1 Tax=Paenibacillus arenilitoris TaxID=2772299 RepID=A0A927H7I0_9BACL|nr:GNAT family N-acetyltransferase [Paenibacillus arenilitoris]